MISPISRRDKYVLGLSVFILIALRIFFLNFTPPGFYLDEAAGAAHAVSMLKLGVDAWGAPHPLFTEALGGGFTTPVYLYPLVEWIRLFGTSELAFRSFSLACTLIAILILFGSVKLWLGLKDALFAAFIALALPWSWVQGTLAWDPAMVPLVVSIAIGAFSWIYLRSGGFVRTAMLWVYPISLVFLAYVYPPGRVTGAILFVGAYAVLRKENKISNLTVVTAFVLCVIAAVPLIVFMVQPASILRSQQISVFHNHSFLYGIARFFFEFLRQINPSYLFLFGDANRRHGTGFQGTLGFISLPAILVLLASISARMRRYFHIPKIGIGPDYTLLIIGLVGILAALIPCALTNNGQPNSLRPCSAWPFAVLVVLVGWRTIFKLPNSRVLSVVAYLIFIGGPASYLFELALIYPSQSAASFDVSQRKQIGEGQRPPNYPDLALKYYEMR